VDLELTGRRALVTGSRSGIGEAIATTLAAEGATVVVHGRRQEAACRVVDAIVAADGQALPAIADLRTDDEVERLAEQIHETLGGIDILVNNAGSYANRTWWTATSADWLALYDANVVPTVRLVRALVPAMRDRGFGRVIQLASGEATQPFAFMPHYAAAKASLVNLTVSLAQELAGSGVTASTRQPWRRRHCRRRGLLSHRGR
jgi:3-oxoacyl-[acyl-carrier protein] reductase